jgi:hypothetical protein
MVTDSSQIASDVLHFLSQILNLSLDSVSLCVNVKIRSDLSRDLLEFDHVFSEVSQCIELSVLRVGVLLLNKFLFVSACKHIHCFNLKHIFVFKSLEKIIGLLLSSLEVQEVGKGNNE